MPRIRPVITARTNADHTKVARLQAIAVEASEQTGRLDVPQVLEPVKLEAMLKTWDDRRLLFCDEAGDALPVLEVLRSEPAGPWAILIGPEGGFSPAEREALRAKPYAVPANLGPRILRADTCWPTHGDQPPTGLKAQEWKRFVESVGIDPGDLFIDYFVR